MNKNFLKDFSIYGIGGIISRFVGVITAPIYTRLLSTEGYGLLDLVTSISAILIIFATMEMHSGYARSYYEVKDKGQLQSLRGSVMLFYIGSFLIILLVFILLMPFLKQWVNIFDITLLIPVVLQLLPTTIITLALITIQFEHKPVLYSLITIGNLLLTAAGGVFAVVYLNLGVSGILWSNTIVSFIVCLILFTTLFKYTSFNINITYLKEIAVYSMPIVPARLSSWVNQYIGRIFIAGALSLSMLGIYSIAIKVGLLMTLAGGAFKQTWSPQANKLFTQKKPESVFADMLNHYLFGFALFAVLIITATPMIVHILAPVEFYSAIKYVGFIVVAVMWNDVTNIVGSGNAWERKTYYNTYGSFAAACISIILLYLFIEQGGVLTATLTLIVASVIKSIINLITSQNNHPIPYSYSILIVMLLFSISFALISYLLYSSPIYFTEWQASGTLLLVGIVSLFYMNKLLLKNKMITAAMLYMEEIKRGLH